MYRMFFLLVFCAFTAVNAQLLPSSKPVQAYMTDSTGKLLLMDFGIKLTGIKDVNTPFSVFSSRPLMIYYFSPFCPHCQRSYGGIQQVAKEYEQKGLTSLAISIGSVGKKDILMFMEERKASIPFYQDSDQDFSKKYGDGYVPRLYLISPDGKIVRYTALENENLKEIKADIEKLLGLGK
ncbi:MAG: TlpA family protein disulfide reductase [Fibromonadales bacterium]|nr:TlpA family protein disulfide reductase [Fibromonadales bacterium]